MTGDSPMLPTKWICLIVGLCLQLAVVFAAWGIYRHYQYDGLSWIRGLTPNDPLFWIYGFCFLPIGILVESAVFGFVIGFVMKRLGVGDYQWDDGFVGSVVGNRVYLSRAVNSFYGHESFKAMRNSYLILSALAAIFNLTTNHTIAGNSLTYRVFISCVGGLIWPYGVPYYLNYLASLGS
jgi:hypothetical protein